MNPETALWLSLGAALLALVYGVVSAKWILGRSAGSERMQAIATAIQEGAKAYISSFRIRKVIIYQIDKFNPSW